MNFSQTFLAEAKAAVKVVAQEFMSSLNCIGAKAVQIKASKVLLPFTLSCSLERYRVTSIGKNKSVHKLTSLGTSQNPSAVLVAGLLVAVEVMFMLRAIRTERTFFSRNSSTLEI